MRSLRVLGGPAVLSILSLLVVAGLGGCGMLKEAMPDQGLAYQKSRQAEENLELPPDLKGANFDDAMDVPPVAGGATYSQYADGRAQRRQVSPSGAGAILPTVENVE